MKKKGDPNGRLTLTNVVAQSYTAQVSAVGYTNTSKAITVNNNQQVNITLSRASCTITFNITNGANALVQLSDGSTVNLNSSGGGSVSKPCGEYSYTISKEGHSALSGGIDALSNVTIRGVMTGNSDSMLIGSSEIVEIAVIYSPLASNFQNVFANNPNRGIVVRPIISGTDQITLLGIATAAFDYAVAFRPLAMQVVAIGGGGGWSRNNLKGGGSGYLNWAKFTTLPDVNETLTVSVNVGGGGGSGEDGQPTTVSIPPYVPTITATGGGNGATPYGQNNGYEQLYGTGFAAKANGNGTSVAYIYSEALSIWSELAMTPVAGHGVGGGGGKDKDIGHPHQPQSGAVFLLIRGVIYY